MRFSQPEALLWVSWLQDSSTWPRYGPKTAQDGPRWSQRWPKMSPRGRQDWLRQAPDNLRWPKIGPRWSKTDLRRPKIGPTRKSGWSGLLQNDLFLFQPLSLSLSHFSVPFLYFRLVLFFCSCPVFLFPSCFDLFCFACFTVVQRFAIVRLMLIWFPLAVFVLCRRCRLFKARNGCQM